jgi:hypothetical protein
MPNLVLIIDNASYHNVQVNLATTSTPQKKGLAFKSQHLFQ